jgi:hypothetical protein
MGINTRAVMPLITSTLRMEAETVSEMLDCKTILTWLITQDDFLAYSHHESFRSSNSVLTQFVQLLHVSFTFLKTYSHTFNFFKPDQISLFILSYDFKIYKYRYYMLAKFQIFLNCLVVKVKPVVGLSQ